MHCFLYTGRMGQCLCVKVRVSTVCQSRNLSTYCLSGGFCGMGAGPLGRIFLDHPYTAAPDGIQGQEPHHSGGGTKTLLNSRSEA
jgi:hypothetical protein